MIIFNEKGNKISNNIEIVEQNLVKKYIQPGDKVLELGARYGAVSITTNKIIKNKEDHYVVEPDHLVWDVLESNMKYNECDFNIIKGIIGNKKYKLGSSNYSTYSIEDKTSDIESYQLPNINFNSLIVDCEGYFEIFFDENKDLFTKLNKIIIEADRPEACDYERVFKELEEMGWKQVEYIKEPTCPNMWHHVFIRDKPNILFCSLSDRAELSKPMFDKLKEYCNINNYKCVLEDKVLDSSRAPSWSKIKLLQREMQNNRDIDYIVWIDDDIIITNKNIKFEDLIKDYPFNNILISAEVYGPFNCGVLVCKNNEQTYNYLTRIWCMGNNKELNKYKQMPNWEQEVFIRDYPDSRDIITVIPHRIIQSFHRASHRLWREGDFAAHITGMSYEKRIEMRDEILKII